MKNILICPAEQNWTPLESIANAKTVDKDGNEKMNKVIKCDSVSFSILGQNQEIKVYENNPMEIRMSSTWNTSQLAWKKFSMEFYDHQEWSVVIDTYQWDMLQGFMRSIRMCFGREVPEDTVPQVDRATKSKLKSPVE